MQSTSLGDKGLLLLMLETRAGVSGLFGLYGAGAIALFIRGD